MIWHSFINGPFWKNFEEVHFEENFKIFLNTLAWHWHLIYIGSKLITFFSISWNIHKPYCHVVYSCIDSKYRKYRALVSQSVSGLLFLNSTSFVNCLIFLILGHFVCKMERVVLTYQSCCRNEISSRLIIYVKTLCMPTMVSIFLTSETYIISYFYIFETQL